jgi:hypothetical protein
MAVLTLEENFLTILTNEQLSTEVHLNLPFVTARVILSLLSCFDFSRSVKLFI